MIWDCLMVRNEMDMLQCRFEEFDSYGLPVMHLVAESTLDFRGRPKSLIFDRNLKRFQPWQDQIVHVVNLTMPEAEDPWVREHHQRDCLVSVLRELAHPDDLVLICDADEIPSKQVMHYRGMPRGLLMRTAHSAVDWLYPAQMPGSVVASYEYVRGLKLSAVRDGRSSYPVIYNGGWHLSWLGGPQSQAEKLGVSCHLELPESEREVLSSGSGYRTGWHHDVQMVAADVDDSWPKYVRERRCPPSWFRPRPQEAGMG